MRILIVDDEPLARARLEALLKDCVEVKIVGSVGDGEAALAAMATQPPDVLLLDIGMPGLDGQALAARLTDGQHPQVIFCTAYQEHAVHAFELGAADYVLKPVRLERLREALRRARQRLAMSHESVRWLHARVRGAPVRMALDEVICLLAEEKYVVAHCAGDRLLLDDSLRQLQDAYPRLLVRLHRNCLAPAHRLLGLKTLADGRVLARLAGTDFSPPVSRRNLPALRKLLRAS